MKLIHAGVERCSNAKGPQYQIFDHGFMCKRSKQNLVPHKLNNLPHCRPIDEVVRLGEEHLEKQHKILLILDEDSLWQFLIIG